MRVRVKICGITCERDARAAVEAGADAVGFVFYPSSRRFIAPERAREIATALPPFVDAVGVFVNESREVVERTAMVAGLTVLQFHGEEDATYCRGWRCRIIKAFRTGPDFSPALLGDYRVDAFLLDGHHPTERGGTGRQADWELASQLSRRYPVILAGGLSPENVREAILRVRPYGVDVSSGVETAPGRKDHAKMRDFMQAVREACAELEEQ